MKLSNFVFETAHKGEDQDSHQVEHLAEIETEFDYILMIVIPMTAMLVGEALETSGFVPLILICLALRFYARPNLSKDRETFLRLLTRWLNSFIKKISYTLIGVTLPMHLHHHQTSYLLGCIIVLAQPVIHMICYFMLTRIF